jgi:hypothetical protein
MQPLPAKLADLKESTLPGRSEMNASREGFVSLDSDGCVS